MNAILPVGIGLLAAGFLLLWAAGSLRRRAGLPAGRVIYSDTRTWQECPEPLYDADVNLVGKPDYLVQRWRYVIPVEVKSGQTPAEPYRSHVLQLAAYCFLTETAYGTRPPYGLIHYGDRTFAVKYTAELEDELLDTLDWMREDMLDERADRNHNDPARCQSCTYALYCDQRLA
jgi:CRISPR-associated exonuclease Cas4